MVLYTQCSFYGQHIVSNDQWSHLRVSVDRCENFSFTPVAVIEYQPITAEHNGS